MAQSPVKNAYIAALLKGSEGQVPFLTKDDPERGVMSPIPEGEENRQMIESAVKLVASLLPATKALKFLANPLVQTGGAVALTGDPLAAIPGKAGLAMLEGSKDAEAAFRSGQKSMLSRKFVELLKGGKDENLLGRIAGSLNQDPATDNIMNTLVKGLSNKELTKYGTPEFLLDKYLPSTRRRNGETPHMVKEVTAQGIMESEEAKDIMRLNNARSYNYGSELNSKADPILTRMILEKASDAEDYLKAKKEGKQLFEADNPFEPKSEIYNSLFNARAKIEELNLTNADVGGKSLQQLMSVINKKEDQILKTLKKSMEEKTKIISKRTGELFNSQADDNAGMFVKLESSQDLAHETDVLNHCIGAVDRQNDKYVPAFDTVTGKLNKVGRGPNSFQSYEQDLINGDSEFYSYRPKGLPEFTVEIQGGRLKQAYGEGDRDLTTKEKGELDKLLNAKGYSLD